MPKAPKPTRKILVSVWNPVLEKFRTKVEAACLRRDAFLDRVVQGELDALAAEDGPANSPEAKRCIEEHFTQLLRKPVGITLATDTIARLDQICNDKNVVRDAFINRILFCLVADRRMLEVLFPIEEYRDQVFPDWEAPGHGSLWRPIETMIELTDEPFAFIRECLARAREDLDDSTMTFYQTHIPDRLFGDKVQGTLGLNVLLADIYVPGHPANVDLLDDLLPDLAVPKRDEKQEV